MIGEPVHRTIVAIDVEGFTRRPRRDVDRLLMRQELYRLLEQALARAGLRRGDYQNDDRGDGILVLLNAGIPKTRVLPWLVLRLAAELNRYNKTAPETTRLRLRAVVHAGEVASDDHGHASKDLNLTFRLLDSDLLRGYLANARTSLVLLVSSSIYNDIIEQGYRDIDAEAFQPVQVAAKAMHALAWVYVPGRHNAVATGQQPRGLTATPGSPPAIPHELPTDIPDFTGHEASFERLLAAFTRAGMASPTVIAVHGVGGVGKSALAIHAAHQLAARFPDGQLYLNLQGATAGLRPLAPVEALARLLRALGFEGRDIPAEVEEAAARFRSRVAGRRILLVLDNAVSAGQIRPLLPASPTCAALITSRQVLATVDGASHVYLDVLSAEQAIRLLERLAGVDRLAVEPLAAADVARQCDYLPLALRIAGARLAARPNWPVRALAERLGDERTRLDELESADLAVRSCFQVSYQALRTSGESRDRTAARMFRLLGLHRGPEVSTWTAAALLDAPPQVAETALERLVDAQLLRAAGSSRYAMHDLLLLFAREQAGHDEPEAQRRAALERMLDCYLATMQRAQQVLQPGDPGGARWRVAARTPPLISWTAALAWFEEERANLFAAAYQAVHGPTPMLRFVVRLAEVMFWFLVVRTNWHEMESLNRLALYAAGREGDRRGEAQALNDLGYAHLGMGRPDRAIAFLERSRALFAEQGDRHWESIASVGQAEGYRGQGELERAVDCLKQSLPHLHEAGDPVTEGGALGILGLAYCDQGRFDEAIDCLEQSLRIRDGIQNPLSEAMTLTNLGEVHHRAGHRHTAVEFYERGLSIYRDIGDRRREAETLWQLGHVRDALSQQGKARSCWHGAQAIFQDLGVPVTDRQFRRSVWV
jgi:tetratricopeptide (TPR) repeat protein